MAEKSTAVITGGIALIAIVLVAAFVTMGGNKTTDLSANASGGVLGSESGDNDGDTVTPMVTREVAKNVTTQSSASPSVKPTVSPSPTPNDEMSSSVAPSPSNTREPAATPVPSSPSPSPSSTSTPVPTPSDSPDVSSTPSPSPTQEAVAPPRVVINEVAWMGTEASSDDEWLELYNASPFSVNLSGWILESVTGNSPDPVIKLSGDMQAGGYLLLERTFKSRDLNPVSEIAGTSYFGALSNSGEVLELRNANGDIVDSIDGTGSPWCGAGSNEKGAKATMERIDPMQGGGCSNWATNDGSRTNGTDADGNPIAGTPGAKNSVAAY